MKRLTKYAILILLAALFLVSVASCTYYPPEGYTKTHHTYEEILAKLQEEAYSNAFEAVMGENGKYSMVKNEKNIAKVSEDFCDKLKQSLAQQASQQTISL